MKILQMRKTKNNLYELVFNDGEKLLIHEELIIKHRLIYDKELTAKIVEEIKKENEFYIAMDRISKLIYKKALSKEDVKLKLKEKPELINRIIQELENRNLINDDKYCRDFIDYRVNFYRQGKLKIIHELEKKSIPRELIQKHLNNIDEGVYEDNIKYLILKKQKTLLKYSEAIIKQKIQQYLNTNGYTYEEYASYLNLIKSKDQDNLKRDFEKIKKRYEIKYQDKVLKLKIIQALIIKGYKKEDISKLID